MDKLSTYAVGGLTVASLLSFISPDYVKKIQIKPNDPKLKSEYIHYDSPKGGGSIKGLLSRPADTKVKLPGIIPWAVIPAMTTMAVSCKAREIAMRCWKILLLPLNI